MVGIGRACPLPGQDGRVVRVAQISQFSVCDSDRLYCCLPSFMDGLEGLVAEDFPKTGVLLSPEVEAFNGADLPVVQVLDG